MRSKYQPWLTALAFLLILIAPGQSLAAQTVNKTLERALDKGAIDEDTYDGYRTTYNDAVSAWKRLGGARRQNLGSVIFYIKKLAKTKQLTVSRMPAVFTQLERNREWWSSNGTPAVGARTKFGDSLVIYQYYPGQGLQLQPLANCGAANGHWQGKKFEKLKQLLDELISMRVERSGEGRTFSTMEYYFPFGGGKPPWFSGMATATCMQALTRAAAALGDPNYNKVAESMLPAFKINAKKGVRVSRGGGNWYALYNFAPGQYVLNAQLQTLVGLYDFSQSTGNAEAKELFEKGNTATKATLKDYDTGAWSLYQPGQEADLNYHKLQRDFLRNLCKRTADSQYCAAATRFTNYLSEPPVISNAKATPATIKRGKTTAINFKLSKISRVGLTVTKADGEIVYQTSAQLSHGSKRLFWTAKRKGSYSFSLSSKDLAGNSGVAATGQIKVA